MGKKRKQHLEPSIFDDHPLLNDLLEWRDSPEGERAMEVFDALSDLIDEVQVDAKQRKFVWPDGKRLTLLQSITRTEKRYPDITSKEIEEHLLYWIESGFAPRHYSREQFAELDRLAHQWLADHAQRAA